MLVVGRNYLIVWKLKIEMVLFFKFIKKGYKLNKWKINL